MILALACPCWSQGSSPTFLLSWVQHGIHVSCSWLLLRNSSFPCWFTFCQTRLSSQNTWWCDFRPLLPTILQTVTWISSGWPQDTTKNLWTFSALFFFGQGTPTMSGCIPLWVLHLCSAHSNTTYLGSTGWSHLLGSLPWHLSDLPFLILLAKMAASKIWFSKHTATTKWQLLCDKHLSLGPKPTTKCMVQQRHHHSHHEWTLLQNAFPPQLLWPRKILVY